ncbi:hypothetical protein KKA13_01445 [Patescibacteria group bacterium]|nr:hypothetical protein [Patescibacteria group bacterium]MBU1613530.1 hypothetical protein [Patescibacteria group bacterium]
MSKNRDLQGSLTGLKDLNAGNGLVDFSSTIESLTNPIVAIKRDYRGLFSRAESLQIIKMYSGEKFWEKLAKLLDKENGLLLPDIKKYLSRTFPSMTDEHIKAVENIIDDAQKRIDAINQKAKELLDHRNSKDVGEARRELREVCEEAMAFIDNLAG